MRGSPEDGSDVPEDRVLSDTQSDSGSRDAEPEGYHRFGSLDFWSDGSSGLSDDDDETMASAFIHAVLDEGRRNQLGETAEVFYADIHDQQRAGSGQLVPASVPSAALICLKPRDSNAPRCLRTNLCCT